jgi:DNA-binding CsgD family transcriptional regulator
MASFDSASELPALPKGIELWKPSGGVQLDNGVVQLFQSGFFKQYQVLSEQLFFIMDHSTMKYPYVSDNFEAITGYSAEKLYNEGIYYILGSLHPDDLARFKAITNTLLDTIAPLPKSDILECCMSYDYRIRFADGTYHSMLQHNIPLTLNEEKKIVHVLTVLCDISMFKRNFNTAYRVVVHKDESNPVTIAEGTIGNAPQPKISLREKEIIKLTAKGMTEKQIAELLCISIQTVKTHRKNLLQKTQVKNSAELVSYSLANLII